jgi:hypothetical protein
VSVKFTRYRVLGVAVTALLLGAVVVVASTRSVAHANVASTELSASSAANLALSDAREWGDRGEVTIELARGTLAQTRALMNGGTVANALVREQELQSSTIPPNFCFGGANAPCSQAEEEEAKQRLYEESQRPAYLVAMTGGTFSPQEKLRRGTKAVTGSLVVFVIDAYTGARLGLSIGANMAMPKLAELTDAARYIASAESSTVALASINSRPPFKDKYGSIAGTARHAYEVVVVGHRPSVRAHVGRNGRFRIASIRFGSYRVAGRLRSGHYCPAKTVRVLPGKVSTLRLAC